ncbi:MAG TPA: ABC transporter ATP-binding protein [Syntrophorhabdaceae bacterium]|nr:ABC transporter ATP-binding protein [Syntrophorhabdaceae bacterium]
MIRVRNLTYTYPEADQPALENVSLDLQDGELVLLVGASASGKSTFLHCLNGLIPHVLSGAIRGDISINGLCPYETSIVDLSRVVGTVFQNPESQIFMLKVEDDVAFGCENLMMSREEVLRRRDMALKDMGLTNLRQADTMNLSGGMKQRLAISSIYAMGPAVFLFDEPTADLDAKGRREFLEVILALKKMGHTILLAEHRYEEFVPIADRVITFEQGRTVEGLTMDKPAWTKPKNMSTCEERAFDVELESVFFQYDKNRLILEDIDLRIRRGELVAVRGDNGSGKSTLLKIMAGILKPFKGTVKICALENPTLKDGTGKVGFLFQNPDEQLFTNSVEEEIMFGPKQLGRKLDIEQYLVSTNLTHLRKKHPHSLSRGQRQMLAVRSVLALDPQVLLLDEPTTGLDEESWRSLLGFLSELADSGKTVIFSTHHPMAREYATRIIGIKDGRVIDEVSR